VSEAGRAVRQALALAVLSVIVAAAVHSALVLRFGRGDFKESFILTADVPGIRLITLSEGEDLWRAENAVFFDARPAAAYGEGHVPRAQNLPSVAFDRPLPAEVQAVPKFKTLVVYCEGGDCQTSLLQARRLHDEGFTDVRVMTAGWSGWATARLPQEKGHGQK
jgi:rhodanese-related sulfurtransferase